MKKSTFKFLTIAVLLQLFYCVKVNSQTVVYYEGFDSVNVLLTHGWKVINNSNPLGVGTWTQGNNFPSAAFGRPNSYAQVDYSSVDSLGFISNWLLTDTMLLQNDDTVTFSTLSYNSTRYPDNLECRLSLKGKSDSVGTADWTVGDFTTLLVAVNPFLDTVSYPTFLGIDTLQKHDWTLYKAAVTGLPGLTWCRLAFRYFVTNGGFDGTNSSSIGLDEVMVRRFIPAGIAENNPSIGVQLFPNPARENVNLHFNNRGNYLVNVFNSIGQNVLSFKTESDKTIDVTSFSSSIYTVNITDANSGTYKSMKFIKQ